MKTISVHISKNIVRRVSASALLTFAVFSAVLLGGVSVQAGVTYNWISATPDNYTNPAAYSPTGVPGIADTNIIGNATVANATVYYTNVLSDPLSTNRLQSLLIGSAVGSSTFTMNDGVLLITNGTTGVAGGTTAAFNLGNVSGGVGAFIQSGGTLVVARPSAGLLYYQDSAEIGNLGNGAYTINGGTANILCGIETGRNGTSGSGTFTVNGGTVVDNGWFGVGGGGTASDSGIFNLSSGILYVLRNPSADGDLDLGQSGKGIAEANISNGTLYCAGIRFYNNSAATETVNISGGDLYIGYFGINTNSGATLAPIVNISGGTFHSADMLPITTNTIGQTNTILSDGTNWTWAPSLRVNLTNSSFLVNGTAGSGIVTFAPETSRTITLNNAWSGVGGLTMSGAGTLVLNGANNFSGALTLNGGTLGLGAAQTDTGGLVFNAGQLDFNNNASLLDSTITIPGGSTLDFNASASLIITNDIAGPGNLLVSQSAGTIATPSGNLTYSGSTLVSQGILQINNLPDSSSVIITNNSGLVCSGTIAGPVSIGTPTSTVSAQLYCGTYSPPNIGTMTVNNNVTLGSNAVFNVKLAASASDELVVNGNLSVSNATVNVLPLQQLSPGSSYVIATYSGSLIGAFSPTITGLTRYGFTLDYSTLGQIKLDVSATQTNANLVWDGTNGTWAVLGSVSNWFNTGSGTLDVFNEGDAVTFANATTNYSVSSTTTLYPASMTINDGGSNYTFSFSGNGRITGGTGITKNGGGTTLLGTGGGIQNDYTGPVQINGGILELNGANSLGATNSGTTVASGATLDLHGNNPGAEPITILGNGAGGTNGAIKNSAGTLSGNNGPRNVTLTGDTLLNAVGRIDLGNNTLGVGGGVFNGNGYNLTAIGTGQIWMHELGDIGVSNIFVNQGTLGLEFTIGAGSGSLTNGTITVAPGATFGMWQVTNAAGGIYKNLSLTSATLYSDGSTAATSNSLVGPVSLVGTNNITANHVLNLGGVISGAGAINLTGIAPLYLQGANTYTGPTFVGAGSDLVLGPSGSIATSPLIQLKASGTNNSILDASQPGSITFGSGQTLIGSGGIIGNATANANSILSPGIGTTAGTLLFTNNLTLNGNTNIIKLALAQTVGGPNDVIYVNGNLNLTGVSTIEVVPNGVLTADQYVAMYCPNGSINGSSANFNVVSTSPRFTATASVTPPWVMINLSGVPAPLLWYGGVAGHVGVWDFTTTNWYNLNNDNYDLFYNGDAPTFDDTSIYTNVTVPANVLPGLITMNNIANRYTFTGNGVLGGTLDMEGHDGSGNGGTLVLAMSALPAFTTIDSSFGTLVYNIPGMSSYTNNSIFTDGNGGGYGKVVFGGTNTVVLTGDNYDGFNSLGGFQGQFIVTNGILQYTNVFCWGMDGSESDVIIMTNNGTLDFNGVPAGNGANAANPGAERWLHISGNGYNGMGALYDSKNNQENSGAFVNLSLDGDASIGSPIVITSTATNVIRWDQHLVAGNQQQMYGNGHKLTKVGGGTVIIYGQSDGDTHLGDIDVAQGRLGFQCNVGQSLSLGEAYTGNLLSVESNAVLTLYGITNSLDQLGHGGVNKVMWLKGNYAALDSAGNNPWTNNFDGPVFLTGTNVIVTRSSLNLWNDILDTNGPGGFVVGSAAGFNSSQTLYLYGANTYTGPTIISNGVVVVGANSSLGSSSYIQINSGTMLDASAMLSSLTLGNNQTMSGNGTVIGPTNSGVNVVFNSGSTLAAGYSNTNGTPSGIYTLTVSNNLVFNSGSTNYVAVNKTTAGAGTLASDQVTGLNSVTLNSGSVIVITNIGTDPLVAGDAIPLFNSASYNVAGFNTNNIVPPAPGGANLIWDTSTLGSDGMLRVGAFGLIVGLGPANASLYQGQTFTFKAVAVGTQPIYYQWSQNGSPIPGATNATYAAIATSSPVNYSCLVSNAYNGLTMTNAGPVTLTGIAAPTSPYAQAVLANGPIAYWRLDETSGTLAHDYVGGHGGAYTNVQQGVSGYNPVIDPDLAAMFGTNTSTLTTYPSNSLVLENDRSALGLPNIDFSQPTNANAEFSVEAWVKIPASQISGAGIVAKGYGGGGEQFDLDVYGGDLRFFVRDAAGGTHGPTSTFAVDGNWHYVVAVCDEAGSAVTLYIDGTNAASSAVTPGVGLQAAKAGSAGLGDNRVSIGARTSNSTTNAFNFQTVGTIDEVALYNYALSPTQIAADYQAGTNSMSGINGNPTNIVFSATSTNLTLSWPSDHTGWTLQSQTNDLSVGISTNWVDVSGSTATNSVVLPINLTNGSVFYRLKYQQ